MLPAMASRSAETAAEPGLARAPEVHARLLAWYHQSARDLPWRRTRDPYAVLVSEIMLQQTQVDRVIPKWQAWLERFPTLRALAGAPRAEAIRAWQGLGYNLRAVRLHDIARQAMERDDGRLPTTLSDLMGLKGIGRYTAAAVACFAFDAHIACVDTNVRRVLGRVFLGEPLAPREREIAALAEAVLPVGESYAWNQALMDLGAAVCSVSRPDCDACPLRAVCAAAPQMAAWPERRRHALRERQAGYDADSRKRAAASRVLRGRLVEAVRHLQPDEYLPLASLGPSLSAELDGAQCTGLVDLARKLADEGLVALRGTVDDPARLEIGLPG